MCKQSLILIFLLSNSNVNTLNYPCIKDYLRWKNIKVAIFLTCERTSWTVDRKVIENFKHSDIWMSLWNMSNVSQLSDFDYDNFLLRSGYPFCVVVDWECDEIPKILKEISKRKMFHYERYWLMFGTSADQMVNVLNGESINIDAEVAIIVPYGDRNYKIQEVYNPSCKKSGQLEVELVGGWNQSVGLDFYETKSKFDRRHNLTGTTFMAEITIPKLPKKQTFLEYIESDEMPYMDTKERGNYRVFQILCSMFNFKLKMRRGKIWGAQKPNGYWIGVVGSLNRSEIDISVSSLRWENDRYGLLDQTTDTFYIDNLFVFRHPRMVESSTVFVRPFDGMVWLLIGLTVILFSIVIRNLGVVTNHYARMINRSGSVEIDCTYANSFGMVFAILFQQGFAGSTLLTSSRIAAITYLLFSLAMYQFYCSFIVGSLLTEPPKTIKTMKQLSHSGLDLAMDELPYIKDIFHYNTEKCAVEMYNKIVAQPNPLLSLHRGLDLVKKGSLAFNTDGVNARPILKSLLTDNEMCELQEVRYVCKIPTGPGLPKKSPLRELIKIGIRKLYETGILSHLWRIWVARLPKCSHSVDLVPVDLLHFSSALCVLSVGIQISLVILVGEMLYIYCLKKWRTDED